MASKGRYHEDVFGVMISAKASQEARASLAGKKAELLKLADLVRSGDAAGSQQNRPLRCLLLCCIYCCHVLYKIQGNE